MNINSKTKEVYDYIIKNPNRRIKEISGDLRINERKVRYEIGNLNFLLSVNGIKSRILNTDGNIKLEESSETLNFDYLLTSIEKLSIENRRDLLILKILLNGELNINRLSGELEVSRTTLKKDLKYIDDRYGIYKGRFSSGFIKENIDELDIRKILVEILLKYFPDKILRIKENVVIKFLNEKTLSIDERRIKRFLDKIIDKKENGRIYSFFYLYIMIAILRVKLGKKLEEENVNKEFLKGTEEYDIIDRNIGILCDGSFSENEKLQLVDYFIGFSSYSYNTEIFEKWIEVNLIIKNMISDLEKEIEISFSNDKILLEGLLNHVKPAIYRAKNKITLEGIDVYFNEENYLDKRLMKKVEEKVNKIEKLLDIKFRKEEIILFTVHFQASIERNRARKKHNRKILLMCVGGYGTTTILVHKLKERYELEELKVVSYLEIFDMDLSNYDGIIATIDLKKEIQENLNIDIIKVSPFLIEEDIKKLDSYFNGKKGKNINIDKLMKIISEYSEIKNREKLERELEKIIEFKKNEITDENGRTEDLNDIFSKESIRYIERKIERWEEVIDEGVRILHENGKVDIKYSEDIKFLIKNFGSYMVVTKDIAIPHAESSENVYEKGIATVVLKHRVKFPGNKDVKILFFLSSKEKKDNLKIIEKILMILEKFSDKLTKVKDEKKLLNLLAEIKAEVKENGKDN